MAQSSILSLSHWIPVILLLFSACIVESRRSRQRYRSGSQGGSHGSPQHTRGADPLPWWAITLVFVGGVLGLFFCVMALKKIYEKKRQKKIRSMLSRRSANIQRRLSQQQGESATDRFASASVGGCCVAAIAPPEIRADAPPTYEQSQDHTSLPPAYVKEVDTSDEQQPAQAMATTPSPRNSVAMPTAAAPPSYDVAQNDGSEVVEVGGAVSMTMNPRPADEQNDAHNSSPVIQV